MGFSWKTFLGFETEADKPASNTSGNSTDPVSSPAQDTPPSAPQSPVPDPAPISPPTPPAPQSEQKTDEKKEEKSEQAEVTEEELSHINQEMYKKSAELAERNKALSLLQNINELILIAMTNPEEVARKVVSIMITESDFQCAAIYLYDKHKKALFKLANGVYGDPNTEPNPNDTDLELPFTRKDNLIVQAVAERKLIYNPDLINVFDTPPQNVEIKSVFISHLYVRNELIGAIVIGMREEKSQLSDYRRLLLSQLSELVGIGIDNSLLYNEVQVSNLRLKELDKLKDEFVSVASHELRTPMTAIKSYLWMALQGKGGELNEKQRYYIERGYNSVERLIRLVNDMLNISRIESGRITINMHGMDIQKLVQEVVDEVKPRASEVGVNVEFIKSDNPLYVQADPDKIREVLINLVGNSLKFTPKDGKVSIILTSIDGFVEIAVRDTGSGIEPEDIDKLFQKFGLLAGSYTTNQTAMGTGLGLYISKSIITLHRGKIWASSEGRGKGATFTFTLKKSTHDEIEKAINAHESSEPDKNSVDLIHTQV